MSKKIVVKLDLHDNKDKQKAMKAVSALVGIDSISMDMATQKMTVIGMVDPVNVVSKLRKFWNANIDSVGPAKEPEKKEEKKEEGKKEEGKKEEPKKEEEGKKEEPKKEEAKKEEAKKEDGGEKKKEAPPPPPTEQQVITELINQYKAYNPYMNTHYFVRSIEENPNSCVIC